ncbi:MAG: hypothetical protein HQL12_00845 [Candidatus Omnitrophica bacterium]|nr:hypothetical protein [Candidatus Omnitrophota bacterium]
MKFDIKVKNPESGFERALAIYLKLTSKWFEWLGWILILGTLHYVAKQSKSGLLSGLVTLTYAFMWAYFIALFNTHELEGFSLFKSRKLDRISWNIIAVILSACSCWLAVTLANRIGEIIKA